MGQQNDENQRQVEEVAMDVLENKRERPFTPVRLPGLAHRARRWIAPKSFVISSPVVITGETKTARRPQNEHSRRNKSREPCRPGAKPGVRRISEQQRRIEGRQIGPELIVSILESGPRGINDETGKAQ